MKIDAYRNLNDECISLKSRESETRGQVINHVDRAVIRNVEFVVQPAGRKRVLEEERKNVHAFVRGVLDDSATPASDDGVEVTYNPYEYDSFVTRAEERPVSDAAVAVVTTAGVIAYEPTYVEAPSCKATV